MPNLVENGSASSNNKFNWATREDLGSWIQTVRLDKGNQLYAPDESLEEFFLIHNGLIGIFKQAPPTKAFSSVKFAPPRQSASPS